MPTQETKKISETAKKVAMILAHKDYQDTEYQNTRKAFDKAGFETKIVSSSSETVSGTLNRSLPVDIILSDLKVADFDAVIFIGGPGAEEYVDNPTAYKIAQDAITQDKVLAAICIAPEILAKAQVLKNKKATVWSSIVDKSPIKVLQDNGVEYVDQNVVQDGKIITANGPDASSEFGKTIVDALNK